jgi:uncharacterized membrane protein
MAASCTMRAFYVAAAPPSKRKDLPAIAGVSTARFRSRARAICCSLRTFMAVVLRSLALLSVSGASIALFAQELYGTWLTPFITANTMSLANRTVVIVGMAIGAAVALLGGLVAWWFSPERLQKLAHLTAPAMLLAFVPPLCETAAWPQLLGACIAIGAFLLLGERLFRMAIAAATGSPREPAPLSDWRSFLPPPVRRWGPPAIVLLAVIGYAVYFSIFTLRMHGRFQTYNFDLGQYDNIFWSTLHGYPLRDSPLGLTKNWHELRNHASLSVFFLLPFYAIKPGGPILLVIQSCVLALGAIPLYRFTARRLPRSYALVLVFAYLLYPPMHGMQFYDFHMQPIASTFVLLVIDFVDDRRYWLCALAFIIAAGCREDISVGLATLGAFLALSGHRVKPGIVIAVGGAAYFVVIRFVVMPSFGGWGFHDVYKDLLPTGARSFGGIIATMVSNPVFLFNSLATSEKLRYMLQILLPIAFLPVRRSYLVVSIVPGSIFTILTTQYPPTIDIGFQYSAHFIPYVFTAAAVCLASFGMEGADLVRRRAAMVTLVVATVICGVHWGAVPPRDKIHGGFSMMTMRKPTAAEIKKDKDIRELHAMIPPDASVAMSEAEMTHVSRLNMKGLRDTNDADYLLYATGSGFAGGTNADRALSSGEYEKIAERPGLALLKRKAKPAPGTAPVPTNPPVPTSPPAIQVPAPTAPPARMAPPSAAPPPRVPPAPGTPPSRGLPPGAYPPRLSPGAAPAGSREVPGSPRRGR